ncbi:hypothetical protein [Phytobacter sp. V91]|uniref:hypothetical protein n=1 Tax=Phytobacter sp. V91 TaxID=3369425 RepID=UPI003F643583
MAVGKFYAEKNSMVKFESPHETIPLTDDIKKRFIDEAIKQTANSHLIIYFV